MTKSSSMTWEQAVEWLRQQPDQCELVKACFFDDPLLEAVKRYARSEEWLSVKAFLPKAEPGQRALDVGAGRGIAAYALANDGWQVAALEPDPSALVGANAIREVARLSGLPITVEQEWGEHLPFADATFDVIHARQVLHHAHNLPVLCAELYRVLKPGGVFVATREHVIDTPENLTTFRANHPLHNLYGGECAFRLDHYLDAITDAGFLFKKVISPFQSAINYFPMTREALLHEAKALWPWEFELNDNALISFFDQRCIYPGRLYSFVAHKPDYRSASNQSDEVQILTSQIVVLQAKIAKMTLFEQNITSIHQRLETLEANLAVRVASYVTRKLHKILKR